LNFGLDGKWIQKLYAKINDLANKTESFGSTTLNSGNYYARFINKSAGNCEATLDLSGTYREKPYEKWYNLACSLLEIAIPMIVTGLVLFSGL